MKQQPLLVMWPGGAFPGVPFPLAGGKKTRKRRAKKVKKTRSKKRTN
jgi:hypothetical protein